MLSLLAISLASHPVSIDRAVREQRAAYNAAISRRDLTGIAHRMAPGYVVLPGLTGTPLSREGLLSLFAKTFRDRSFITYARSPIRVEISDSSKRVAESGRWVGTWNKSDGIMKVSGVYQAFWISYRNEWTLVNESFVTLKCTGSRECAAVD